MMRFEYPGGGVFHDDSDLLDEWLHMGGIDHDHDHDYLGEFGGVPGAGGAAGLGPGAGPGGVIGGPPRLSRRARQALNLKTDWLETPTSHLLRIDIPGVKREHIKVSLEDKHLRVHGDRPKGDEVEGAHTWRRMERSKGRFSRRFPLPDLEFLDVDAITARLEDGVLAITIPIKQREEKPAVKHIEISA